MTDIEERMEGQLDESMVWPLTLLALISITISVSVQVALSDLAHVALYGPGEIAGAIGWFGFAVAVTLRLLIPPPADRTDEWDLDDTDGGDDGG